MTDIDNADESTTPCPTYGWCISFEPRYARTHEHYHHTAYVPATLSNPQMDTGGASFPSVGIGLTYSEKHDPAPGVFIHLIGPGQDTDVMLRPDEAVAVARALDSAIHTLLSAENPRRLTRDEARVRAEADIREGLQ